MSFIFRNNSNIVPGFAVQAALGTSTISAGASFVVIATT